MLVLASVLERVNSVTSSRSNALRLPARRREGGGGGGSIGDIQAIILYIATVLYTYSTLYH